MNESVTARGRAVRWAGAAGLLVAGAIGGGLLMGAASANAATTPSSGYSSTPSTSGSSSTRAGYPAGDLSHQAMVGADDSHDQAHAAKR